MYETDHIAKQYGHEVIRLPVAHTELNPIELAWAVVKDYCRKNNQLFTLKGIEALIPQGFQQCSPDKFKHFCEHVKQIEEDFWQKDGLLEKHLLSSLVMLTPIVAVMKVMVVRTLNQMMMINQKTSMIGLYRGKRTGCLRYWP